MIAKIPSRERACQVQLHWLHSARVIRNIIFDWCGTLIDDLEAVWKATNRTFQKSGVAPLSLEVFRRDFSLPFRPFYDRYTPHIEAKQLERWYLEAFEQEQSSVGAFAHSESFLKFCKSNRIEMFVLSSLHRSHFERHLEITGFEDYFRAVYAGVVDKRDKIGEILARHDLSPKETLFVGDMQHDVEAARCGGTRSCGVLTGFNTHEQLQAARPDLIVEHLGELQQLLHSNQGDFPTENHFENHSKNHFDNENKNKNKNENENQNRNQNENHSASARFPFATVGALIFDNHNRVLMIQTHKWSHRWGIPGGKIRFGERSEAALRREVFEETNLEISEIQIVMIQEAIFPNEFFQKAHFLLIHYRCKCRHAHNVKLNHEAQKFRWMQIEEAMQLPLNAPTKLLLKKIQSSL